MTAERSIEIGEEAEGSADALWCRDQYFAELSSRFENGFDPAGGYSNGAATAPAEGGGIFLIARLDGRAVGCGMLRPLGGKIGEIKRMWVSPQARGMGLAKRMLQGLEDNARAFGWTRLRLDTNKTLSEAQVMYRKAGYREIERYNDNPYADFWFEKEL